MSSMFEMLTIGIRKNTNNQQNRMDCLFKVPSYMALHYQLDRRVNVYVQYYVSLSFLHVSGRVRIKLSEQEKILCVGVSMLNVQVS